MGRRAGGNLAEWGTRNSGENTHRETHAHPHGHTPNTPHWSNQRRAVTPHDMFTSRSIGLWSDVGFLGPAPSSPSVCFWQSPPQGRRNMSMVNQAQSERKAPLQGPSQGKREEKRRENNRLHQKGFHTGRAVAR